MTYLIILQGLLYVCPQLSGQFILPGNCGRNRRPKASAGMECANYAGGSRSSYCPVTEDALTRTVLRWPIEQFNRWHCFRLLGHALSM